MIARNRRTVKAQGQIVLVLAVVLGWLAATKIEDEEEYETGLQKNTRCTEQLAEYIVARGIFYEFDHE